MFNRNKKRFAQFDWVLFIVTALLCVMGLVAVRSATYSDNPSMAPLVTQIIATILGFIAIAILQWVDIDYLRKLAIPIYLIILLLLIATRLFGFGMDQWGADSWLKLGPVIFQPSEFSKLGIIVFLAWLLERYKSKINKPTTIILIALTMAIPVFLILKQPDLGTAAVIIFFVAVMIFYADIHWGYILAAFVLALVAIPILYASLSGTQQDRILNFLDPFRDPRGSNYQILQGIVAIGSGQLSGRGYLQGTQTHFGFIPEQDTDYIFSVIAEEFGFIGGIFLIACYFILLFRMIMIARRAKDPFEGLLVIGIAAMIFIHVFENIGMTIGLMPVTGIPLPLISNGGTFQLLTLASIGIILSISTQRRPLDFSGADGSL
ncbi:rod shape-determining protein RodA [Kallipyga gabonensis]|uniref:rod shape-determining protein RodA n=1 Tax=Kallipyga gabonensis TaxID=1686287 RepID=UPI0006B484D0|nr:rod shape-determining protein RodA [Kallipyga gabonensis]